MLCMQEGSDIYKYRVRIINPRAKKESITIDWHGVTEKFETVLQLKQKLINTLSSHVPPLSVIDTFNVGYFHGRPQTKSWMVAEEDLQAMYASARDKDIRISCYGVTERIHPLDVSIKICLEMKRTCLAQTSILLALLQKRKSLKTTSRMVSP